MATLVWYDGPARFVTKDNDGLVGRWMDGRGRVLVRLAKNQVGVDTGDLKASIGHRTTGKSYGIHLAVYAKDQKALMHHEGTAPHAIHPKDQKVLRFVQNGKVRFAKRVFHPGTKPNRFLTDNVRKVF